MSSGEALWARLNPDLVRCLNVSLMRVYLRRRGLITAEQQEQLFRMESSGKTRRTQAEQVVVWLDKRGCEGVRELLCALRDSLEEEDGEAGHRELVRVITEELERDSARQSMLTLTAELQDEPSVQAALTLLPSLLLPSTTLPPHQLSDNGYSLFWTLPHNDQLATFLQTALSENTLALREAGAQRVTLDTPTGKYIIFQQAEEAMTRQCSEHSLLVFSKKLCDWESLAIRLGVSSAESFALKRDHQSEHERKVQFLLQWRRRLGSRATYRLLYDTAVSCEEGELADVILSVGSHRQ